MHGQTHLAQRVVQVLGALLEAVDGVGDALGLFGIVEELVGVAVAFGDLGEQHVERVHRLAQVAMELLVGELVGDLADVVHRVLRVLADLVEGTDEALGLLADQLAA